jgi:hypothetical protein
VITQLHRHPGTSRKSVLGAALALVLTGVLLGPSAASANSVRCKGTTTPVAGTAGELDYKFKCSEEIKGYSLVSNMSVAEFSTTADVLDRITGDPVPGQTFNCEGPIPGSGFGCAGGALNPNLVAGKFAIEGKRCVRGWNQQRTWVVAVDAAGTASGPMPLRPSKCARAARRSR